MIFLELENQQFCYIVNIYNMDLKNNFRYAIWIAVNRQNIDMLLSKTDFKWRWLGKV